MVLKLDYFTISRVIRPRKRWRKNENDWHMECKRPHFSYDLECLMKRKKCWNKKCLRKYAHMGECNYIFNLSQVFTLSDILNNPARFPKSK